MANSLTELVVRALGTVRGLSVVLPRLFEFFLLYHSSKDSFHKVEPFLVHLYEKFVDYIPVSGIGWSITKRPGYETRPDGTRGSICWEAPIAITIFSDGVPVCGVGIEFVGEVLRIRQMQGVRGVRFEKYARYWPRFVAEAAKAYAEEGWVKTVRIYRADQSLFFNQPEYPAHVE